MSILEIDPGPDEALGLEPGVRPGLRIVLTNRLGEPYGEVLDASGRGVGRGVRKPRTARFTVGEGHPMRHVLRGTSAVLGKVYDEDDTGDRELLFVGPITAYERNAGDELVVGIGLTDPIANLERRLVHEPAAPPAPTAEAIVERGRLMGWLLDTLNSAAAAAAAAAASAGVSTNVLGTQELGDTGVRPRTIAATPTGLFGGYLYTQASSVFSQLASGLEGPDWHVYPLEPTADPIGVALGALDVAPIIGQNRPDVVFEYGTEKANVASYREVIDPTIVANRVVHLPPGFPEDPAAAALTQQDAAAIAAHGLNTAIVSADLIDAGLRAQLLADHLAVRRNPRQVITWTMAADLEPGNPELEERRIPRPGHDFDFGDIVTFRAVEHVPLIADDGTVVEGDPELVLDVLARIYDIDIADDDDGVRQVTVTVIAE